MKAKRFLSAALAAIISISCATPAWAASTDEETVPDLIFYRKRAIETFEGEIDIRNSEKGTVTGVEVQEGEEPALFISGFDDSRVLFDSLYKSVEQNLTVTRDEKEYTVTANLAVYDRVMLNESTGSVTLTVKDNRTLQTVPGAMYSLYRSGKLLEKELVSDSKGKITVDGLTPGEYELRPIAPASGYQEPAQSIPFTIGGIELAGGDYQIRTSAGKKVTADEHEVLIAGQYSPDIELTATKESQISAVSVLFQNAGAALEAPGKSEEKTFSTAEEAQEAINERKNNGQITGAVEISYELAGKSGHSTCNYIQYVEKEAALPTPTPTPNNNHGNGTMNQGGTVTPVPVVTPAPTPDVRPIQTPTPVAALTENLTIAAFADNGKTAGFVFQLLGVTEDGNKYNKEYKTDENGEIHVVVPAGTYTVTPKDCAANKGYELPQGQSVQLTASSNEYLSFSLVSTERTLSITVTDDEGLPLEGVTVGIFPSELLTDAGEVHEERSTTESRATDVSQQISDIKEQEEREALLADPFAKKNALKTGKTDENGLVELEGLPVTELLAVPIDTPAGYTMEKTATEIPAGFLSEAEILCEYVKVDLAVVNRVTGRPVIGVAAKLLDSDGNELAQWETDEEPHPFIRVPKGEYSLNLSYDGQEETLSYEVIRERTYQEFTLETDLTGIVEEKEQVESHQTSLIPILIAALVGVVVLTLLGVTIYRKLRKKGRGIS